MSIGHGTGHPVEAVQMLSMGCLLVLTMLRAKNLLITGVIGSYGYLTVTMAMHPTYSGLHGVVRAS